MIRQDSINQIWDAGRSKNDPFALTVMGLWLYEGKFVQQNAQLGYNILSQLAPNIIWAHDLLMYIQNFHSSYDVSSHAIVTTEATQQMGQAIEQGNLFALTALGELYYDGKTVPQHKDLAISYLQGAAKKGCLWAQDLLKNYGIKQEELEKDKGGFFCNLFSRNKKEEIPEQTLSKQLSNSNSSYIAELNSLIGLTTVKQEVLSLSNFVAIQKQRESKGLRTMSVSYHCVFSGSPGTGKTTVARIVAGIYKDLGILKKGHLVEVQRSDLVAEYVGQTAVKTNKKIDEALDGILFIDEAYTLSAGGQGDYGQEAINTLLKRMEDDRDRLVVILAGYSNEIKQFINSNPGLESRFNRYIHFEDYSAKELMDIFMFNLKKSQYSITREACNAVYQIICNKVANKDAKFGNARYVRNLTEQIVQNQANRLSMMRRPSKEQLVMIEESDVSKL